MAKVAWKSEDANLFIFVVRDGIQVRIVPKHLTNLERIRAFTPIEGSNRTVVIDVEGISACRAVECGRKGDGLSKTLYIFKSDGHLFSQRDRS